VNLRRTLATVAASLALVSALAACGFNYPTDRINNITAGANDRNGTVEVLNAAIVSKEANLGTLVATLVNTNQTQQVTVTSITGDGTAVGQVSMQPFPINPNSVVNLASQGGISVEGTFSLGQFVKLTIAFDNGETAVLSVPVVSDAGQWAGLDHATPSPTQSPSAAPTESSSSTASPTDTSSPSASAS
jgi:hypothetical protein